MCVLVCIRSNARVHVILPDWHNYGWDVWRNTLGVSSDHLHSSKGCSLVQAGKTFIQGEVSLDQPEGLIQESHASQVWYAWALMRNCDRSARGEWFIAFFWMPSQTQTTRERTHEISKSGDIAPSSARHKIIKLPPCLFFPVGGASFPLMWGHGL